MRVWIPVGVLVASSIAIAAAAEPVSRDHPIYRSAHVDLMVKELTAEVGRKAEAMVASDPRIPAVDRETLAKALAASIPEEALRDALFQGITATESKENLEKLAQILGHPEVNKAIRNIVEIETGKRELMTALLKGHFEKRAKLKPEKYVLPSPKPVGSMTRMIWKYFPNTLSCVK